MPYAYCRDCDEEMGQPSLRQTITRNYDCRRCGSDNSHMLPDTSEVIVDLLDRLEALEETVARLDF